MKKVLAYVLVLCLIVGSLPMSAVAADEDFVIQDGVLTKYNGPGGDVVIPDGVTSIGEDAFMDCANLTSISIPNGITHIKDRAFSGCTSLTTITIPDSVTDIYYEAFNGCDSLTTVTIPNSLRFIGAAVFKNCRKLESIQVETENVYFASIEGVLYQKNLYNNNLEILCCYPAGKKGESFVIPSYVTYISDHAFDHCSNLTTIIIPNSVTGIASFAFDYCTSLTNITIPDSMTSIASYAFFCCTSLADISIPNSVTDISACAFSGCTSLTTITIPDSVTSIGEFAFSSCTSLTTITIPNSVASIDTGTFQGCTSLTTITIPNSVTSIGRSAFQGCSSLATITIPDSVTSIGTWAFSDCSSLAAVTIPNSVISFGSAFSHCESLTTINIPNSVTSIDEFAFSECTRLTTITIPNSVTSIGSNAFQNCTSLTTINIPNSVTSIGESAFYACTNLTTVTIPNSVTSIGEQAFLRCTNLAAITIPGSVTHIDRNVFYECTSLATVTIQNGVTSIGGQAFYRCTSLATITIPSSVTSIGSSAFEECNKKMNGVYKIEDVYYTGTEEQWKKIEIDYQNNPLTKATIHYTSGDISGGGEAGEPSPEPTSSPLPREITAVYPEPGKTLDKDNPENGTSTTNYADGKLRIFFDKELANDGNNRPVIDTSSGTLEIHRMSDDAVVYQVKGNTDIPFYGENGVWDKAVRLDDAKSALDYGTRYYVTMPAGFIKFADGTGTPAIETGMWWFDTAICHRTFFHASTIGNTAREYDFTYDDSWFKKGSSEYQHDLVKMSLNVAMAAYDTTYSKAHKVADLRFRFIKDLLNKMGFDSQSSPSSLPAIYEYPDPNSSSIGYAIGGKNIRDNAGSDFTLLCVAVRGGNYTKEWGSNFLIGSGETHQGFDSAARTVLTGINKYIADNKSQMLPKVKIWISGYSRGAATTNLVAKKLIDGEAIGVSLTAEDIYAFCFECPRNTKDPNASDEKYSNICNIVNPADIVPKVAMEAWGYTRYGTTRYTPYMEGMGGKEYHKQKEIMEASYRSLVKENFDSKLISEISGQVSITDAAANMLADIFVSQNKYNTNNQEKLVGLLVAINEKDFEDAGGLGFVLMTLGDMIKEHPLAARRTMTVCVLTAAGVIATVSVSPINILIWKGVIKDVVGAVETALTDIKYAHYAELCMAWLDSLEGEFSYADPKYRILYVNCPVNVKVMDSSGILVGNIISDQIQEIEEGIVTYIDHNGQKVVCLPNDEEYRIELEATDSGTVTYTATEYNMDSGKSEKVVSYYEVDVKKGDTLTGIADNLDNEEASYPLTLNGDDELIPSITQSGATVQEYAVNVTADGNGTVTGGGSFVSGEFAKVTATANEGNKFLGWYIGSQQVSSENEYRFLVDKQIDIVGKFARNSNPSGGGSSSGGNSPGSSGSSSSNDNSQSYNVKCEEIEHGTISVSQSNASSGSTVTVTAQPDEGYQVDTIIVIDSQGKSVDLTEKDGKFTFTMPSSNVTIKVDFVPEQFTTASPEPSPSPSPRPSSSPSPNPTSSPSPSPAPWKNPFPDVKEDQWYIKAVEYVCVNGLMAGYENGKFGPSDSLTRAQFAQILYSKAGNPAAASGTFADVKDDQWYASAVNWAAAQRIVAGIGNGKFAPGNPITREQLATMLWRYAGSPEPEKDELDFSDAGKVSKYAWKALCWASENGIVSGKGGGNLDPKGIAKRSEAAQMLMKYFK